jgi:membrane-bound metal-dependent hydrolase YbcI (DUF457 family)
MIAGHFAFAAAVKSKARATPFWALLLACQWLDVVFAPLFVAGVERLEPLNRDHPGTYGGAVIHADYTHSLFGALLLSALLGALFWRRHGGRSAVVIGLVSLSHWFLDLPMHRGDMQIWPGAAGTLGFGLWRYPLASATLELVIVLAGSVLYFRAARETAGTDASLLRRARLCGAGVLVAGLLTLGLNVAGM